ncbi:MAG TPA: c-type cytochrome [Gammaproteobacteria bacterium]|jgi:putative heme-binding domain-containing protein|nr:c-type cytochrome [Gammaproteobacteria bacterium]
MRRTALIWVTAVVAAGTTTRVAAQHATALDIEDGRRVFESSCANCHGPDGNLIAGIDFGRGVFRRKFTDDELAATIIAGIPNTPMPPNPGMSTEQALRVVEYLRSMSQGRIVAVNGDARRGRTLFEGKGECTECHAVGGVGSPVGPDLTRIGALRRAGELERSLLDPKAEVQPENRFYKVVPKSGKPVTGRLLNRDTFTVQLLDTDERLRSFRIADLREHGFAETPMPSARRKLSTQEIADVVSYLTSLRGQP